MHTSFIQLFEWLFTKTHILQSSERKNWITVYHRSRYVLSASLCFFPSDFISVSGSVLQIDITSFTEGTDVSKLLFSIWTKLRGSYFLCSWVKTVVSEGLPRCWSFLNLWWLWFNPSKKLKTTHMVTFSPCVEMREKIGRVKVRKLVGGDEESLMDASKAKWGIHSPLPMSREILSHTRKAELCHV